MLVVASSTEAGVEGEPVECCVSVGVDDVAGSGGGASATGSTNAPATSLVIGSGSDVSYGMCTNSCKRKIDDTQSFSKQLTSVLHSNHKFNVYRPLRSTETSTNLFC
jgi:hypothetical protein